MYRVLIVDDDLLMQESLRLMILKVDGFTVINTVSTGEQAIRICREDAVDIVFIDVLMAGVTGLEASRIIHQNSPNITIYLLSGYSRIALFQFDLSVCVKEIIQKPVSPAYISTLLSNYKTEHEGSIQHQIEELVQILQKKDFARMYDKVPVLINEIYDIVGLDSARLIKNFVLISQSLFSTISFYENESKDTEKMFPVNEGLISDRKISELWLFRVMNYMFQKNSVNRYPLLENVFYYIEKHIKEDINLNKIIENCAISQGYLSRIFREQFQISVMEYLHMRKIHMAKGYFYFTKESIAEVAFRLGYNESSYFSKVFKKYEKMTVKEYKNQANIPEL